VEEDPLAAPPRPALVLAEAPEAGGGEVEAERPRRAQRGFGRRRRRLAFGRRHVVPLGGAGLVDAAGCRGQQGELGGGAFAVQQRGKLPQAQVGPKV